jgi:hypothetical protein
MGGSNGAGQIFNMPHTMFMGWLADANGNKRAQVAEYAAPTQVFDFGAEWHYVGVSSSAEVPDGWRGTGFDDAGWASGLGQLGFGDGDEATVIGSWWGAKSYLLRKTITLSAQTELQFKLVFDDAAVVYFNGVEVYRSRTFPTSGAIEWDTAPPAIHTIMRQPPLQYRSRHRRSA